MKNLLLILFCCFMLTACKNIEAMPDTSEANNFEILTLMSSDSNSVNKVWVGTFQIAFNNIKNKIIKHDIKFVNEPMTEELKGLNNEEFNSSMINETSYYESTGEISPEAKEQIKKDIKQKFNETSDIIDGLDWTKAPGSYYAYVMLKKEFEFLKAFNILKDDSFNNSEEKYKYFGIEKGDNNRLSSNVSVLFYNNKDDYAVKLNTKNDDIVYLYRTDSNNNFKSLYSQMNEKAEKYDGSYAFNKQYDSIKIPYIKINEKKVYKSLCNKIIEGTDFHISQAIETIQLDLNEKGGKVKSEAIIMVENTAIMHEKIEPREFNFDKTFVMFLVDSSKTEPYLALRIKDLKGFQ